MENNLTDYELKIRYFAHNMGIPRHEVQDELRNREKIVKAWKAGLPAYTFAIRIGQ